MALLANKAGPIRLGFAVLLKAFGHEGRFPRSKLEIPGVIVVHLAQQAGVPVAARSIGSNSRAMAI